MIEALRQVRSHSSLAATPFDFQVIDVDADPVLEEKYGELVPVLLAGEREICHYHLDHAALSAYLAEFQ
jgi:hypothetical protein